jgi:hypothetical protein
MSRPGRHLTSCRSSRRRAALAVLKTYQPAIDDPVSTAQLPAPGTNDTMPKASSITLFGATLRFKPPSTSPFLQLPRAYDDPMNHVPPSSQCHGPKGLPSPLPAPAPVARIDRNHWDHPRRRPGLPDRDHKLHRQYVRCYRHWTRLNQLIPFSLSPAKGAS